MKPICFFILLILIVPIFSLSIEERLNNITLPDIPRISKYHILPLEIFVFHTENHLLADLQIQLLLSFGSHISNITIFVDTGSRPPGAPDVLDTFHLDWKILEQKHNIRVNFYPVDPSVGWASKRNSVIVNFALQAYGITALKAKKALLILDGDIFPLTHFSAHSLLTDYQLVCRRHPTPDSRFCWIGWNCFAPSFEPLLPQFDVSPSGGDAGSATLGFLNAHQDLHFHWLNETILRDSSKTIFNSAFENDVDFILSKFDRCDRCGSEIFYTGNSVWYHMISASSQWRHSTLIFDRVASIHDSLKKSLPFFRDDFPDQFNDYHLLDESIQVIRSLDLIPPFGRNKCC